jgi:hypothetical protein
MAITAQVREVDLPARYIDSGKQRQQKLAAGFAKWPTFWSRPGMIEAIAIQGVFCVNKTLALNGFSDYFSRFSVRSIGYLYVILNVLSVTILPVGFSFA